ncbi:MAG: DUF1761 domain-containing protein [Pseudomonadales bacterium]
MQVSGIKVLPLLAATVAIYLTGFVIYGLITPSETWMLWSNISAEDMERIGMSRMPLSVLMPIMIAIGVALVIKWRKVDSMGSGAVTGLLMALFFLVGGRLYGYVYGVEGINILMLDSAHLMLNGLAAGAVLGGWSNRSYVDDAS